MKYTALVGEERVEIEFELKGPTAIEARIGNRSYTLESRTVEPGVYWFNWQGHSIEVTVTTTADGQTASVAGRHLQVEILDSRTALKKAAQHGHAGVAEIRAPMPGKIVKLLVTEGSEVNVNQGILVMEAMKMQNEIKSPKKGIVKKVHVTEGLPVSSGDVLASVE